MDVNLLIAEIRTGGTTFDLTDDQLTNLEDLDVWVRNLKQTWYGDANLDGEFNATDFVDVFTAGKYETQQYAGWAEGDWNGDGVFDTADFVTAFEDGGYERGPRPEPVAVPEPGSAALLLLGLMTALSSRRR